MLISLPPVSRFDGVFGEAATNRQLFETALKPMVTHLFNCRGGHGTCFAYGQTGSGKTVTMEGLGSGNGGNSEGMYALVADELFSKVGEAGGGLQVRQAVHYTCSSIHLMQSEMRAR